MISNLLYKEFRLALHPNLIVFTLMGPLILIPGYPYTMVFLFSLIGNFINLMYTRENNDIYYCRICQCLQTLVLLLQYMKNGCNRRLAYAKYFSRRR